MGIPWEELKRRQVVDGGWEDLPCFGGKWWELGLDVRLLRGCWVLTLASGRGDGRYMRARHAGEDQTASCKLFVWHLGISGWVEELPLLSLAVGSWLCTEGCLHIADPLASRKFPGHPQSLAVSQLNYSFGESQLLNILTEREWEVLMKWMHYKEATGQFQSHPPFTVYICPRVFDPCDLNSYITLNG